MRMKGLLVTLFVIISTSVFAKEYTYKEVKGDLTKTRIYELKNGLKVYLSVNKDQPRIQTYIAVRTGSKNDPAETTGLAHYLEHLMFKGTKRFGTANIIKEQPYLDDIQQRYERYRLLTNPQERKKAYQEIDSVSQIAAQYFIPNEYDKLMASIGADGTNAFTSYDVTCYVEDIPSNEVDNWAKIQADRFQNMVIRGFHTELEAVYEEYNIGLSDDGRKQFDMLLSKLFPNHPYGTQTTIGTQEHLKNPSIVNIKNYFKKYYVPNNTAICMSGDFDYNEVMSILDKYFSEWNANQPIKPVEFPQHPQLTPLKNNIETSVVGLEAENILMGWRAKEAGSFQADTLEVVAEILSNSKAGLMDLNLEQKMKYLGGGAYFVGFADHSIFAMQGMPKEGQSLNDVKQLLLGEIENLKKGNFASTLLPSVINNMKLKYYKSLESNRSRTDMMMDAFINGTKWSDVTQKMSRIQGMTKEQIAAFANRFFKEKYVAVLKNQGVDSSIVKIEKPAITPIPLNREAQSDFLQQVVNAKVQPIEPKFVDFNKDLTKGNTAQNMPVLYVKNNENGLFTLSLRYPFGSNADKKLSAAADYLSYLGTTKMSAEQLKQRFYELACDYSIYVGDKETYVTINGLNENMPQALALVKSLLTNAKVDNEAYQEFVSLTIKSREDSKAEQQVNFKTLAAYGKYGEYNAYRNILSNNELKTIKPSDLIQSLKKLINYRHTLLYYGVDDLNKVIATVNKEFKGTKFTDAPKGIDYVLQPTKSNSILLAPYDAKNIYMIQYHNNNEKWTPENSALIGVFNEYFGGSMNSVVFQELRETRGLAYSASASYVTPSRKDVPEYAQTYIISQNDKMIDCINAFNSIIDTIPQAQIAFDLAKQALNKRIATTRTTKFGIISKYLESKELGIDYDINQQIYKNLPSIQLKDIVDFEKKRMAHKPYLYIILGDEKNLDIKALEKIAPIKRVSTEQIFGY